MTHQQCKRIPEHAPPTATRPIPHRSHQTRELIVGEPMKTGLSHRRRQLRPPKPTHPGHRSTALQIGELLARTQHHP
ncbi:hypothetical protein, partial [Mycobacterium sp. ACS1612]|uniref:hypothetical protein n=1 Tax=Mycobacterium sp. ACS1612 TaxID=1834117 RepID=UPI001E3C5277